MPETLSELILGDVTFLLLPRTEADQTRCRVFYWIVILFLCGHKERSSSGHQSKLKLMNRLNSKGVFFFFFN